MSLELSLMFRSSTILLGAGLLTLLLRRASAAARHTVWMLGFLAILALPLVSTLFPVVELPLLSQPTASQRTMVGDERAPADAPEFVPVPIDDRQVSASTDSPLSTPLVPDTRWTWRQSLTVLWGLGSVILFIRALAGAWQVCKLKRHSRVANSERWGEHLRCLQDEIGNGTTVQLRISQDAISPMTWGIFRSVILLPSVATQWSSERCRLVLAHEMAHVKRRDGLVQVFVQAACSLYWLNPFVWYAAHRLRIERERACDDRVLSLGADATEYADHLLQIMRDVNSGLSFATVNVAHPSQLKVRLMAILDSRTRRYRLSRLATAALAMLTGVMTIAIAIVQITTLSAMALPMYRTPPAVWRATQDTALTETGTASIVGKVVRASTSDSIPRARIVVIKADGGSLDSAVTTLTDGSGDFIVDRLPAGRYRLFVTHDGDVRTEYGQRGSRTGTPFVLEPGQRIRDMRIEMTPTGSISGRVLNRYGEPIGFANIRAYRFSYARGQRVLTAVNSVRSNDTGEYRLYWLPPGKYMVSAVPSQPVTSLFDMVSLEVGPGAPAQLIKEEEFIPGTVFSVSSRLAASVGMVSTAQTGSMYLPVYYPGVTDAQLASAIELAAGASITGANFVVEETRAVHIRGRVITPTNGPVKAVSVILLPRGAGTEDGSSRKVSASQSGAFDFAGIPPGPYDLMAVAGEPGSALGYNGPANVFISRGAFAPAIADATASRLAGRVSIDVVNDDLNKVELPLQLGANVNGRITIEGLGTPAETESLLSKIVIHLSSVPSIQQLSPIPSNSDSNGFFHLTNVAPGSYRVIVNALGLPPDFYVKSARYGNADLLNSLPRVEAEERAPMEIVLGIGMGDIEARVMNNSGAPVASASVVLIPDAPLRQRIDLFRTASSDEDGKIHLEKVIPGTYKLFAWEDIEAGEWWNPEFMRAQETRGTALRIGERSHESVELRSIPRP